jgi:hypothetical protein
MIKTNFLFAVLLVSTSAYAEVISVKSSGSCRELNIGSQKVVSISTLQSSSRVEHNYTLVRAGKSEFHVYLNYDFDFDKGYKLESSKNIAEAGVLFREKIQACFDDYNDRLQDEYGRMIRLNVYRSHHASKIATPKAVKIKLSWTDENSTFRAHSKHYNSAINCHTLIHEGFHLTGLVDEYEETAMKTMIRKKPKFNRRALGPDSSVMRAPWELDNLQYEHVIFSAQVNTILYPNCSAKNSKYYTCGVMAYKTGSKKIPEYCQSEDWVKVDI